MSKKKDSNAEIDSMRETIHNLIDKIDNKKYIKRIYNIVMYIYTKNN